MNVFLDVGGHLGQSIGVALDGTWAFDLVHSFEPDADCVRGIEEKFATDIAAGRLVIHRAALGGQDGEITLLGDNSIGGATTVRGQLRDESRAQKAPLIDAKRFVETLPKDARIYIKLNCEGAEVEILNRLCDLADISNIAAIVADFDVVKRGGGYWEKRRTLKKCAARGLPVVLAETVMVGKSHAARLSNWFAHHPALMQGKTQRHPAPQPWKRRVRYAVRDLRSAVGLGQRGYS
jgi:FkbM family methyltransferase